MVSPFTPIQFLDMYSFNLVTGSGAFYFYEGGGSMMKIIYTIYFQMSSFTVLIYIPITLSNT